MSHAYGPTLPGRSTTPFILLLLGLLLSGCGLTGNKQLADADLSETDVEVLAEKVETDTADELASAERTDGTSMENHVTQPALGRNILPSDRESHPGALARVVPASSRVNLVQRPETSGPLPVPTVPQDAPLAAAAPIVPAEAFHMVKAAPAAAPVVAAPPQPAASTDLEPPAPRTVDKIGADDFQQVVLDSEIPVIVDFYADWCKPCQTIAPLLDEVAQENAGLRVVKVNIDHDKELARAYRVKSIPTVMVFRDGKLIAQHNGLPSIRKALSRRP